MQATGVSKTPETNAKDTCELPPPPRFVRQNPNSIKPPSGPAAHAGKKCNFNYQAASSIDPFDGILESLMFVKNLPTESICDSGIDEDLFPQNILKTLNHQI